MKRNSSDMSKMAFAEDLVFQIRVHTLKYFMEDAKDAGTSLEVNYMKGKAARLFKVDENVLGGPINSKHRSLQLAFLGVACLFNDQGIAKVSENLGFHWQTGVKARDFVAAALVEKSESFLYSKILLMIYEFEHASNGRIQLFARKSYASGQSRESTTQNYLHRLLLSVGHLFGSSLQEEEVSRSIVSREVKQLIEKQNWN